MLLLPVAIPSIVWRLSNVSERNPYAAMEVVSLTYWPATSSLWGGAGSSWRIVAPEPIHCGVAEQALNRLSCPDDHSSSEIGTTFVGSDSHADGSPTV